MPGPAATVGSMHVCPMCNPGLPPPPHVGGPVSGPGIPTVLIGGKAAAVMGDICLCAGPPDTIVMGEATVLIGGKPAATVGSSTAHGGIVTMGDPTVLIGTGGSGITAIMPVKKLPFPKITPKLKVMASISGRGTQLKKAVAAQQAIQEAAENNEGEPKIYNLRWVKEDVTVRDQKVLKIVTLTADVINIPDGQTATIKVVKKPEIEGEEEQQVIELTGTVENKSVTVEWELEDASEEEQNSVN